MRSTRKIGRVLLRFVTRGERREVAPKASLPRSHKAQITKPWLPGTDHGFWVCKLTVHFAVMMKSSRERGHPQKEIRKFDPKQMIDFFAR